MTNKAVRKAVIQIALLITLVVTANAIKPFSLGNVALHTLAAAQSFSFVLPDAAAERIEQANYLAQAYGRSLFDGDGSNSIWPSQNVLSAGLLASNFSGEPPVETGIVEAEIKDVDSCEPGRKSAPAKRPVRRVKPGMARGDHDEAPAGGAKAKEVARPAVQSIAMLEPAFLHKAEPGSGLTTNARFIPASVQLPLPVSSPRLNDCGKTEVKIAKLSAAPRELPNPPYVKISLLLAPQTVFVISRCSQKVEKKDAETEEAETSTETTVGPEEMLFGETFADPMAQPPATPTPECPRR